MSTAAAAEMPVPSRGKKRLILIIAVATLVLVVGGGAAAAFLVKKNADAELVEADDAGDTPAQASAGGDARATPIFVPLDPFTVNLADSNADRYAQVGITLEIDSVKTGDLIKAYMPAIRNNILMAIADRTAADLLAREGKAQLAERVRNETVQALGYVVETAAAPAEDEANRAATEKKRRKPAAAPLPVKAVHFSNFIIQ